MIEYCKSDRGDKAFYAFRHPNIMKWSMLVTYAPDMPSMVVVSDMGGYGSAVQHVSNDFFRGRMRRDPGDHVPMISIEAAPAALMEIELVRRIALDDFVQGKGRGKLDRAQHARFLTFMDILVKAESLPEAMGLSMAHDRPGTPFSEYLVEYTKQVSLYKQEQQERELAEQIQIQRAYDAARNNIMPDWGTW